MPDYDIDQRAGALARAATMALDSLRVAVQQLEAVRQTLDSRVEWFQALRIDCPAEITAANGLYDTLAGLARLAAVEIADAQEALTDVAFVPEQQAEKSGVGAPRRTEATDE